MKIGYARVSTDDQNLDMQLDALREAGCERVYEEHASGKNTERPELQRMLDAMRGGDTVIVYKLDRISRSVQDLESLARTFKDMGVEFVSICDQIDTTTAMGRFFFHVMGAVAELERDIIVERTRSGLEAARARGRVGGRKPVDAKTVKKMLALYDSKAMSVGEICDECGISKGTLYKYVNERRAEVGESTHDCDVPKLKVVDLFCGCGGMSLGFTRAGYDVVAAADAWKPALDVYRANLGGSAIELDLSDVDAAVSQVKSFKPDVIIGGPPCQDFSIAGKRKEDEKAELTLSFADIVAAVEPKCFVMENVPTVMRSDAYAEALRRLREAGYGITAKVLDASLCGVPQARERCFTIGILGESDDALATELEAHLADRQMTVRDYMGDALGTQYYFCMPRSYKRRGVFSIDEPAATIRGMNRPIPSTYKRHSGDAADSSEARVLTEKERGYLQTFPKWFKWNGSKADVNQMIGNAVPVNLSRYVAEVLKSHLQGTDVNGNLSASTFENDAII